MHAQPPEVRTSVPSASTTARLAPDGYPSPIDASTMSAAARAAPARRGGVRSARSNSTEPTVDTSGARVRDVRRRKRSVCAAVGRNPEKSDLLRAVLGLDPPTSVGLEPGRPVQPERPLILLEHPQRYRKPPLLGERVERVLEQ